jgi:hypothetical protein
VYGLEKSAHAHALVMELAEGPTLSDRIAKGAIPFEEAIAIGSEGSLLAQPFEERTRRLSGEPMAQAPFNVMLNWQSVLKR